MTYATDTHGKTAINTTGEAVKWRMYFFNRAGVKILECCEYAEHSGDAIAKVFSELADKKLKRAIASVDSVIDA